MKKGRKYFEESDENADIRLDSDPAIYVIVNLENQLVQKLTSQFGN